MFIEYKRNSFRETRNMTQLYLFFYECEHFDSFPIKTDN